MTREQMRHLAELIQKNLDWLREMPPEDAVEDLIAAIAQAVIATRKGSNPHYARDRARKRAERGICRLCPKRAWKGGIHCRDCRDKVNAAMQARRINFIRQGLCQKCGKAPFEPTLTH